mgnify:FL=1
MSLNSKKFISASEKIAFDEKHRKTIQFNISRYDAAVSKGMARYENVEKAKSHAAAVKRDVLNNWAKYLTEFEENCIANGSEVLWAENSEEATNFIIKILQENNAKLLVKS